MLGTEKGINNLQNHLRSRELELNKERKIRKQLEKQFEKSTEKRLIKELIPNHSSNLSRSSAKSPQRNSTFHTDYQKPIPIATNELLNNNRLIHTSAAIQNHNRNLTGAYF